MSRLTRVLAVACVVSLVGTAAAADDTTGLRDQLTDTQQEREQRERQLAEVEAQAGSARERLQAAEDQLEQAQEALAERERELAAAEDELEDAREQARQARDELRTIRGQLARTEDDLAGQKDQLDTRVRAAFKYGHVSYAEAFTGARDIADFLNSTTYVGSVMSNDKDLVEQVAALVAEVERQRAEANAARTASELEAQRAERAATEVQQATRDQRELTAQVDERREERATALEELQQDAAAISEHLDDLERSEDRVRSQIAEAERRAEERLAAERARQEQERREAEERAAREQASSGNGSGGNGSSGNGSSGNGSSGGGSGGGGTSPDTSAPPTSSGGWLRPTNGRVTSGFGNRTHPVHGGQRLHAGVDLASGTGTPVRASRDGIVSFRGWMNGYGNTVMVSHGDGLVTLYAHLSSFSVSKDAYVGQGQSVGGVGMTGTATGPHLHFEVRRSGSPTNPCGYISC